MPESVLRAAPGLGFVEGQQQTGQEAQGSERRPAELGEIVAVRKARLGVKARPAEERGELLRRGPKHGVDWIGMKRISIRAGNEEIATRREESHERSRDRFAILDVFQQVGTEDGPVAATSQHL